MPVISYLSKEGKKGIPVEISAKFHKKCFGKAIGRSKIENMTELLKTNMYESKSEIYNTDNEVVAEIFVKISIK